MSEQRIEKSKAAVEAADHIPAEKKAELLESLAKLKPAIAKVFANPQAGRAKHRAFAGGVDT